MKLTATTAFIAAGGAAALLLFAMRPRSTAPAGGIYGTAPRVPVAPADPVQLESWQSANREQLRRELAGSPDFWI